MLSLYINLMPQRFTSFFKKKRKKWSGKTLPDNQGNFERSSNAFSPLCIDSDSLRCETKESVFQKENLCLSAFESDSALEAPCLKKVALPLAAASSLRSWLNLPVVYLPSAHTLLPLDVQAGCAGCDVWICRDITDAHVVNAKRKRA